MIQAVVLCHHGKKAEKWFPWIVWNSLVESSLKRRTVLIISLVTSYSFLCSYEGTSAAIDQSVYFKGIAKWYVSSPELFAVFRSTAGTALIKAIKSFHVVWNGCVPWPRNAFSFRKILAFRLALIKIGSSMVCENHIFRLKFSKNLRLEFLQTFCCWFYSVVWKRGTLREDNRVMIWTEHLWISWLLINASWI